MKRFLLLFMTMSIGFILYAQVPQGFNYQAVARNSAGVIIPNQNIKVKIGILQGNNPGTLIWEEEHSVMTNSIGLFSLMIGNPDATNTEGTISSFGDIDWSAGNYFLQVQLDLLDGNGYQNMGTSSFLSVPYALYAKDVENKDDNDPDPANEIQDLQLNGNLLSLTKNGTPTVIDLGNYINDEDADTTNEIQDLQLNGNMLTITRNASATEIDLSKFLDNPGWNRTGDTLSYVTGSVAVGTKNPVGTKLAIQGDDVTSTKPLFEVKRKDGQTVFAVYNDSIRMYVNATPGKGPRGGFAIGGFDASKGPFQDYMRITPDSVRIYIDQSKTKGPRGGFAIGGFGVGKGGTAQLMHLDKDNYFIGHQSGSRVTTGLYNQFFGYQAGMNNTEGGNNVFMGETMFLWAIRPVIPTRAVTRIFFWEKRAGIKLPGDMAMCMWGTRPVMKIWPVTIILFWVMRPVIITLPIIILFSDL